VNVQLTNIRIASTTMRIKTKTRHQLSVVVPNKGKWRQII